MANIPYVATPAGDAAAAPSGAIPIDLFGVESGGEAPVTSVNGEIGDVVLAATDVGAAPTSHTHTVAQVTGLQAIIDDYGTRIAALEAAAV